MADPKTILEFVKKNGVKILDLRFTDLPGLQHHVSYPIDQLSEASFDEGFGMDGSSIRGWAAIHESDMLLIPDAGSYMLDPFTEVPTLVMVCDVVDPVTNILTANTPNAVTGTPATSQPLQIRKVNINVTAKALRKEPKGDYQRINLTTSISPRNLSFRDRYN